MIINVNLQAVAQLAKQLIFLNLKLTMMNSKRHFRDFTMSEQVKQSLSVELRLSKSFLEPIENVPEHDHDSVDTHSNGVESSNGSVILSETDRGLSGTSSTFPGGDDDFEIISNQISQKESRIVMRLRIITVLILICVAAGVSVGIFYIMTDAEDSEFIIQFEAVGEKVIESFEQVLISITSVSGLAIATSKSLDISLVNEIILIHAPPLETLTGRWLFFACI
jgi:hypothetical protein